MVPWVSPVLPGPNSGVSGAHSPCRMLPYSISHCLLAHALHSQLAAPWPSGTAERVQLRACDPPVSFSWGLSCRVFLFLLLLSPCRGCDFSCCGQAWASFLLSPNGRRTSEWLNLGSYGEGPKRRVSWTWGAICNIWPRERDTWVNVFATPYFPGQLESY